MSTMAPSKTMVHPYLFFAGRCEEALKFYETALGAKLGMSMRFSESPDPTPDGMLQPGFENKIMHTSFQVGEMTIMASDGCSDDTRIEGFSLVLSVPTQTEATSLFNALAQGGEVSMPLTKTFWSPCYGMVRDRFGVSWMVMVPSDQ